MVASKVTRIGNSVGVVLPEDALADLGAAKRDTLNLTKAPDGSMRISPIAKSSPSRSPQPTS